MSDPSHEQIQRWTSQYPFAAWRHRELVSPRPERVEKEFGPLASYVSGGRRFFRFETAAARDAFADAYSMNVVQP